MTHWTKGAGEYIREILPGDIPNEGDDIKREPFRKATPSENLRIIRARLDSTLSPAEQRELEEAATLIERLVEERDEADERGAQLAANQCLIDGGVVGDEGGTPYCTMKQRAEAAEAEVVRYKRLSESGESLGGELEEREARMAAVAEVAKLRGLLTDIRAQGRITGDIAKRLIALLGDTNDR